MIGEFNNGEANDVNGEMTIGLLMFNGLRFNGDLNGEFKLTGDVIGLLRRPISGELGLRFCISPSILRFDGVAFGEWAADEKSSECGFILFL